MNWSLKIEKLAKKFKVMEEDYRILIDIMERARKLVTLQDGDYDQKAKFKMDKNGNLEKSRLTFG